MAMALHRLDAPAPHFHQVPALTITHGVHGAHFPIQLRLRQPAELDEDWSALCVSIWMGLGIFFEKVAALNCVAR